HPPCQWDALKAAVEKEWAEMSGLHYQDLQGLQARIKAMLKANGGHLNYKVTIVGLINVINLCALPLVLIRILIKFAFVFSVTIA
ncbi:Hypothetical protein FKW44_016463, partial [Caligus rogercresseyi]